MEVKQSNISVLAMRKEPNHRSEMVSQIIYGDGVILQEVKREWSLIKTSHDDYSGWIESKHFQQFENVSKPEAILCTSLVQAKLKNKTFQIVNRYSVTLRRTMRQKVARAHSNAFRRYEGC